MRTLIYTRCRHSLRDTEDTTWSSVFDPMWLTYSGWTYCSTRSHERRLDPYRQPQEPTAITSPPVIRGEVWRENWSRDLSEQTESRRSSDNRYKEASSAFSAVTSRSCCRNKNRCLVSCYSERSFQRGQTSQPTAVHLPPWHSPLQREEEGSSFYSCQSSAASNVWDIRACIPAITRWHLLLFFPLAQGRDAAPADWKIAGENSYRNKRGFDLKMHLGSFFNQPLDCRWRSWNKKRPVKKENFLSLRRHLPSSSLF